MKAGQRADEIAPLGSRARADESEFFHTHALLAAIVDSSDDAIVSKTLEGRILSWNRAATRIFGYEAHEVIGKPVTIIIPPELHQEERQILDKLRRGERIDHPTRFASPRTAGASPSHSPSLRSVPPMAR
jgi:PAS domain S-box-containing protein